MHNIALCVRLVEERLRLGLSQTAFAGVGGVSKRTQINYEAGDNAPDSNYLIAIAAAGADIPYLLLAERIRCAGSCSFFNRDEAALLLDFRKCSMEGRSALQATANALANGNI